MPTEQIRFKQEYEVKFNSNSSKNEEILEL